MSPEILIEGNSIVTPGTDGAKLVDELKPDQSTSVDDARLLKGEILQLASREYILYKPRWGAFYQTNLEEMLSLGSIP